MAYFHLFDPLVHFLCIFEHNQVTMKSGLHRNTIGLRSDQIMGCQLGQNAENKVLLTGLQLVP